MKYLSALLIGGLVTFGLSACGDPLGNASETNTSAAKEVTQEKGKKISFDEDGSTIGWTGSKIVDGKDGGHKGGFNDFEGEVTVRDDEVRQVQITIQIDSMWTDEDDADPDEDKLKGHLLSEEFFHAEEYPTAKFVSTEIKKGDNGKHTVTGNLTMRGKTKSITFPAEISYAGGKVMTKANFRVDRTDWDIAYQISSGDAVLNDEVGIRFDITATE